MSEIKKSVEEIVPEKPALMQRLRLPLMIGGLAMGLIVFLLIGVGLGMLKSGYERKQFAVQALQFKTRMTEIANEKKLYEIKAEGLKTELEKQKGRVAELEKKLEEANLASQKAESALASATASAPIKAAASAPKAREYVRFGNVGCAVTAGDGSNSWKACLQQGRPQVPAKTAGIAPGKHEEKHVATPKAVEPHAPSAH